MEVAQQVKKILKDIDNHKFAPIYLLMGSEPYYPNLVCEAIIKNALQEHERAFNQVILYANSVNALQVASELRSYPMMSERRLVLVKEAQALSDIDKLIPYFEEPMESSILVLFFNNSIIDKRKAVYKKLSASAVVLESNMLRDYQMQAWITDYYKERALTIDEEAAALLVESLGTSMTAIAQETDKMLKNLPESSSHIDVKTVEANVGISRQFSIFELTKALSYKDKNACMRLAQHISMQANFYLLTATSALFTHFQRVLKYHALSASKLNASQSDKAQLLGVSPYFLREYEQAAINYPLKKCLMLIAILEEYDFKAKGGQGTNASQSDLMMEMISKIINL